jgi:hypothetical protein
MKEGWIPAVIASCVSSGAVAFVYFLIRRMIVDMSESVNSKFEKVWSSVDSLRESRTQDRLIPTELQQRVDSEINGINHKIDRIKDEYLNKETHALICGKTGLELEKMFSKCLKKFEDNMFNEMRSRKRKHDP